MLAVPITLHRITQKHDDGDDDDDDDDYRPTVLAGAFCSSVRCTQDLEAKQSTMLSNKFFLDLTQ
jgi:hypothetical protein